MIVKLCATDLLKLTNGEEIVILHESFETTIVILDEEANKSTASRETGSRVAAANVEDVRARRSDARRKLVGESKPKKAKKTGQRWMHALFDGPCYMGNCRTYIKKGDRMLYDYDGGRALCEGHGKTEYPNLPIPEEVNA